MQQLSTIIGQHPEISYAVVVLVTLLLSPFLQKIIGRFAFRVAINTDSVVDDLVVDALRPFRFVYVIPVALAFFLASWIEPYAYEARLISGLLLIVLAVEGIIKVLNAVAAVIRQKSGERGASSIGYIDLLKLLSVIVGIGFAISITIETDLTTLLSGLGALTAVLMFIFRDTLLSIQSSLRIASWNLIREGDWISVPSFNADGTVESIGLYDIKVRNWDLTTSLVPTNKVLEVAATNFRPMQKEHRARRIQEKLLIDLGSIRLCDQALLEKLRKVELIADVVSQRGEALGQAQDAQSDPQCAAAVLTNFELYRIYVDRYLRSLEDLHQKRNFILVRTLAPTRHGLPMDIFAFVRKTDLIGFSEVQTHIFGHLIAMAEFFDLRFYQTGEEE